MLDRKGYVTREPDPGDSRATIVGRTSRGRDLLTAALDVVAGIEAEYTAHLGADRLALLKEILGDLLAWTDPHGALGGNAQPG